MRGRPKKKRRISIEPEIRQFSPRGKRGRPNYTRLKFEELEAVRLTDFMDLDQKEASTTMGVSQQTFSRILKLARSAIANALINGNIIKIVK